VFCLKTAAVPGHQQRRARVAGRGWAGRQRARCAAESPAPRRSSAFWLLRDKSQFLCHAPDKRSDRVSTIQFFFHSSSSFGGRGLPQSNLPPYDLGRPAATAACALHSPLLRRAAWTVLVRPLCSLSTAHKWLSFRGRLPAPPETSAEPAPTSDRGSFPWPLPSWSTRCQEESIRSDVFIVAGRKWCASAPVKNCLSHARLN
jgi:hypothetical protein